MKKYLIFLLSAAAMLFANVGCQSDMDIQRDDRVKDMRSVYERLSRTYESLNAAFYAPVATGSIGFSAGGYMMASYSDEAQEVSQKSAVYKWYNSQVSATDMPLWVDTPGGSDRWHSLFGCIHTCNEALQYLLDPELKTDYPASDRGPIIAQFYALRAYSYLLLIKRWGGVPVMATPLDRNHDYSKDKRASFAQCVDFIIESCDKAAEANPGLSWFSVPVSNHPELPRVALQAIKSEAALYAASPLWANDYAGTEPYTWERAAAITKEALDLTLGHGGKLVTNTTVFPETSSVGLNVYDKYFLSGYPGSLGWDTETLYQPYNSGWQQIAVWQKSGLPIDVGQISAGACPTQEMVDAYEVLSADGTSSEPLLNLAKPYNEDGTPNFNPAALALGYEDTSAKMYEQRDPRFYSTIYYDGAKIKLMTGEYEVKTRMGGNCALSLSPTNVRNTNTGYYLRKFNNPQSGVDAGNRDGYMRGFRLAELYLNFAEAAYQAYGADQTMPATEVTELDKEGVEQKVIYGEAMSARAAVNAIRTRVEMPAISDSGADFWLRLCNERRVELAFEEHRFFDVRRWTAPDGNLAATDKRVSGIRIEQKEDKLVYSRFTYDRNCYDSKYLKFPISLQEVRKVLAATGENWQNKGWN